MKLNNLLKILDMPRVIKWFFRLLYGVAAAVLSYLFFSLFFDTPIESEIKKSTQKLEQQYELLSQRYDSIHAVLGNIIERDKGVHKILFESEPYNSFEDSLLIASPVSFEDKSNMELGDELISRTGQLYQRISNLEASLESLQRYAAENRTQVNQIPAIQPVENRDLNLLAASFGERINPYYKSSKMHYGVDYAVPVGTAVLATADGIVMEVQTRGQSSGTSLRIKHGKDYETYYSNLYHVFALPGQIVKRGDIVAFSGNSGLSFAPHLHYEVRHRGKAIDPLNYLFLELGVKDIERLRRIAASGMQSFD